MWVKRGRSDEKSLLSNLFMNISGMSEPKWNPIRKPTLSGNLYKSLLYLKKLGVQQLFKNSKNSMISPSVALASSPRNWKVKAFGMWGNRPITSKNLTVT